MRPCLLLFRLTNGLQIVGTPTHPLWPSVSFSLSFLWSDIYCLLFSVSLLDLEDHKSLLWPSPSLLLPSSQSLCNSLCFGYSVTNSKQKISLFFQRAPWATTVTEEQNTKGEQMNITCSIQHIPKYTISSNMNPCSEQHHQNPPWFKREGETAAITSLCISEHFTAAERWSLHFIQTRTNKVYWDAGKINPLC